MGPVMNGAVRCTNQCHCLKMNRIRKYIIQVAQAHEAHLDIGVPAGLNTDAAAVGGQPPAKRWSATASQHSLARLASLCPAVEATAHFTCVGMAPSLVGRQQYQRHILSMTVTDGSQ